MLFVTQISVFVIKYTPQNTSATIPEPESLVVVDLVNDGQRIHLQLIVAKEAISSLHYIHFTVEYHQYINRKNLYTDVMETSLIFFCSHIITADEKSSNYSINTGKNFNSSNISQILAYNYYCLGNDYISRTCE